MKLPASLIIRFCPKHGLPFAFKLAFCDWKVEMLESLVVLYVNGALKN